MRFQLFGLGKKKSHLPPPSEVVSVPESIRITGKPEPGADICRFMVSQVLLEAGRAECFSLMEARGSALFEALFEISGVERVVVDGAFVIVKKEPSYSWSELGKKIGTGIRAALRSDHPLIHEKLLQPQGPSSEVESTIRALFAREVNPSLAAHGGEVSLIKVEGDVAVVTLSGGCQGCGQAAATLKQGIEVAIKKAVPSIRAIQDQTDHEAGRNPYYRSEKKDA